MRQNTRRAVRTVVYAIVTLVCLAGVGWIISYGDQLTMRHIAYGLLFIVGVGSLGYVAENVAQRIRLHAGADGIDAEIGGE